MINIEAAAESESPLKPFIIESLSPSNDGRPFQPRAVVQITRELRTSGLLHNLPGDDLKNLLLVLTFIHPNGWCQPTVYEIAHAMRVSQSKARERMSRLVGFEWNGKPLITDIRRESGMDAYAPSPLIIGHTSSITPQDDSGTLEIRTASRDAVIAYSRERYARPRAEVERDMAIRNGWPLPEEIEAKHSIKQAVEEDADQTEARRRLLGLNVPNDEVNRIMSSYPIERILQQLLWLPYRNAKSKGRFIVAAIDGNYDAPRKV